MSVGESRTSPTGSAGCGGGCRFDFALPVRFAHTAGARDLSAGLGIAAVDSKSPMGVPKCAGEATWAEVAPSWLTSTTRKERSPPAEHTLQTLATRAAVCKAKWDNYLRNSSACRENQRILSHEVKKANNMYNSVYCSMFVLVVSSNKCHRLNVG